MSREGSDGIDLKLSDGDHKIKGAKVRRELVEIFLIKTSSISGKTLVLLTL
jgi:hypothetical protein